MARAHNFREHCTNALHCTRQIHVYGFFFITRGDHRWIFFSMFVFIYCRILIWLYILAFVWGKLKKFFFIANSQPRRTTIPKIGAHVRAFYQTHRAYTRIVFIQRNKICWNRLQVNIQSQSERKSATVVFAMELGWFGTGSFEVTSCMDVALYMCYACF